MPDTSPLLPLDAPRIVPQPEPDETPEDRAAARAVKDRFSYHTPEREAVWASFTAGVAEVEADLANASKLTRQRLYPTLTGKLVARIAQESRMHRDYVLEIVRRGWSDRWGTEPAKDREAAGRYLEWLDRAE